MTNTEKSRIKELMIQMKKEDKFPNDIGNIVAERLGIKRDKVYACLNGRSARKDIVNCLIEVAEEYAANEPIPTSNEQIQKLENLLDGGNEVKTISRIEELKSKLLELKEMETEILNLRNTFNTEIEDLKADEGLRRMEELYDEVA